jgi:hypothetical protein
VFAKAVVEEIHQKWLNERGNAFRVAGSEGIVQGVGLYSLAEQAYYQGQAVAAVDILLLKLGQHYGRRAVERNMKLESKTMDSSFGIHWQTVDVSDPVTGSTNPYLHLSRAGREEAVVGMGVDGVFVGWAA